MPKSLRLLELLNLNLRGVEASLLLLSIERYKL